MPPIDKQQRKRTWSYACIGEILLQGILGVEHDSPLEVLELRVHLGELRGASPVLVPLVLPEAVLLAVGVHVGPVRLQIMVSISRTLRLISANERTCKIYFIFARLRHLLNLVPEAN